MLKFSFGYVKIWIKKKVGILDVVNYFTKIQEDDLLTYYL